MIRGVLIIRTIFMRLFNTNWWTSAFGRLGDYTYALNTYSIKISTAQVFNGYNPKQHDDKYPNKSNTFCLSNITKSRFLKHQRESKIQGTLRIFWSWTLYSRNTSSLPNILVAHIINIFYCTYNSMCKLV